MDQKDYFVRRLEFVGNDFFNNVEIRDASRCKSEGIESKIEFRESFLGPYFKDGDEIDIFVQDKTSNRPLNEKFNIGFRGRVYYRNDLQKPIRVTLGNDYSSESFREDIRIMEEINHDCGHYFITLEKVFPQNLNSFIEARAVGVDI